MTVIFVNVPPDCMVSILDVAESFGSCIDLILSCMVHADRPAVDGGGDVPGCPAVLSGAEHAASVKILESFDHGRACR